MHGPAFVAVWRLQASACVTRRVCCAAAEATPVTTAVMYEHRAAPQTLVRSELIDCAIAHVPRPPHSVRLKGADKTISIQVCVCVCARASANVPAYLCRRSAASAACRCDVVSITDPSSVSRGCGWTRVRTQCKAVLLPTRTHGQYAHTANTHTRHQHSQLASPALCDLYLTVPKLLWAARRGVAAPPAAVATRTPAHATRTLHVPRPRFTLLLHACVALHSLRRCSG